MLRTVLKHFNSPEPLPKDDPPLRRSPEIPAVREVEPTPGLPTLVLPAPDPEPWVTGGVSLPPGVAPSFFLCPSRSGWTTGPGCLGELPVPMSPDRSWVSLPTAAS